jgi:hypothetical protein
MSVCYAGRPHNRTGWPSTLVSYYALCSVLTADIFDQMLLASVLQRTVLSTSTW